MSPIAVKLCCSAAPTFPITAGPLLTPTRNRGQSGRPAATASRSLREGECGPRRAQRVIRLVGGRVEDDHHRVACEALDHPVLGRDDRDDLRPVGVQHGDDLGRGRPLGEGGEALEVGEEDADVAFFAAELGRVG